MKYGISCIFYFFFILLFWFRLFAKVGVRTHTGTVDTFTLRIIHGAG